jgi:hypothetical protein
MSSIGIESIIGQQVYVEVPLPDGALSGHLGELVEVTQLEICLRRVAWVSHTGRHGEFMAGKLGDNAQIEVYPPDQVKRLPRWGASVTDWPHEIPRESV